MQQVSCRRTRHTTKERQEADDGCYVCKCRRGLAHTIIMSAPLLARYQLRTSASTGLRDRELVSTASSSCRSVLHLPASRPCGMTESEPPVSGRPHPMHPPAQLVGRIQHCRHTHPTLSNTNEPALRMDQRDDDHDDALASRANVPPPSSSTPLPIFDCQPPLSLSLCLSHRSSSSRKWMAPVQFSGDVSGG